MLGLMPVSAFDGSYIDYIGHISQQNWTMQASDSFASEANTCPTVMELQGVFQAKGLVTGVALVLVLLVRLLETQRGGTEVSGVLQTLLKPRRHSRCSCCACRICAALDSPSG